MSTFFLLAIIAHLIGDYPLQTTWVFRMKLKSFVGVFPHSLIQLACHLIVLIVYLHDPIVTLGIVGLIVIHHIQDHIKIKLVDIPKKHLLIGYIIDQLLHLTWLVCLMIILNAISHTPAPLPTLAAFVPTNSLLIGIIVILLVSFVWGVSAFIYRKHAGSSETTYRHDWHGMGIRSAIASVFLAIYSRL